MTKFSKLLTASAVLAASLTAPLAAQAEKTLRAGIWLPEQLVWATPTRMFVDHVNEIGEGILRIDLTGPEAIPATEQANALRTGLLDMATLPPGLYKQQVPLGNAQDISDMSVQEQKANGAYDYIREMTQEQLGAYMLASYGDGINFHIYVNQEISSVEDLEGLRLRSSPLYNAFFEALGISITSTPAPDVYTALERGVVAGLGWPYWGVQDLGWDEFLVTRVDPGFYNVAINILINNDTWAGLTDEERGILEESVTWLEAELPAFVAEQDARNLAAQQEAGITPFDAGPEFAVMAADIYWEEMSKIDADGTAELRELFQK